MHEDDMMLTTLRIHVQWDAQCNFYIRADTKREDFLSQLILILCIDMTCGYAIDSIELAALYIRSCYYVKLIWAIDRGGGCDKQWMLADLVYA